MIPMITTNKEAEDHNQEELPYRLFEENHPGRSFHVYISEGIGEAKKYTDLIHKIKTANENDVVYMYLNTPGGYLSAGMQLILAMRVSKAHIVTVLEGEVCSLGSLLFLSADEFIVHDHTMLMIHNHSGGQWGKGHEYLAQADAVSSWFEELAKTVYKNFMTDKEIKEMLDGKDFWFQAEEVKRRLEKMVSVLNKENKTAATKAKPKGRPRKNETN